MYATRVDVFSFGVLVAAVFNGEAPYPKLQSAEIMFGVISGNLRPQLPSCLPAAVRCVILGLHQFLASPRTVRAAALFCALRV